MTEASLPGPVLVTGGSRGLGRAIVEALVAHGTSVAFTYHSGKDQADELKAKTEGRARPFMLDLADRDRPTQLLEAVEATVGPLWGLVNNAGIRRDGLLALTSDEDWGATLTANLDGTFRVTRAVLKTMLPRRQGAIVNISSLTALHGVAGQTAYGATKAAILGLTKSLARELGKRRIRVNAVVPGYVATDMTASLPQAAIQALRSAECLPAGVQPIDVAHATLFLLSPAAAGITGQALIVDAGASA